MPDVRIAQIETMIAAREGVPGYKKNLVALKAELSRLQGVRAAQSNDPSADPQESAGLTGDPPTG